MTILLDQYTYEFVFPNQWILITSEWSLLQFILVTEENTYSEDRTIANFQKIDLAIKKFEELLLSS